MRIAELHDNAVRQLLAAGVSEAAIEVPILLCHVLGISRTQLFLAADAEAPGERTACFMAFLQRRCRREPLAYIIGEREFWSLPFLVNAEVLIPRPETELLLEKAIEAAHNGGDAVTMALDLGTGSGVIAVVLARELPALKVLAVDRSLPALRVAAENARRLGVLDRIQFVNADWLDGLPDSPRFDLVVSNPPYINRKDLAALAPEVRDFEPVLALDGGADGLTCLRRLVAGIGRLIRPGGQVFFEIGAEQGRAVVELLNSNGSYGEIVLHRDYAGLPRVVQAVRKG